MQSIKLLGLRTLIYMVPDLKAAKEWYTATLGIEPYFDEPFYVGFNVGGYELGLHPSKGSTASAETYWGVDDVQAAYKTLLANGATAHEEPSDVGGGIITASVKDPVGNILGLIFNPHFKVE